MTPTNQQNVEMKRVWYLVLWFTAFIISWFFVAIKNPLIGFCLFFSVNLVVNWMKLYVDTKS